MTDAMSFAVAAHGDQQYGDEPYRVHLVAVVQVLRDFGYRGRWADAGALHDTIEDTKKTRQELEDKFGRWVAMIVWACTGVGRTREIRNATIYAKISMLIEAAVVKTADRIANIESCEPGSRHALMYIGEKDEFHENVARFAPPYMRDRLAAAYRKAGA